MIFSTVSTTRAIKDVICYLLLLLSGLGLRQVEFPTERSILHAIYSDKIEKPPNKVQKSTTIRLSTEIQDGLICMTAIFKLSITLLTSS